MSESFDRQIKESAKNYHPEPQLSWDEVEQKMKSSNKNNVKRLYIKIASTAAAVLLIGSFIVYQWISSPSQQNSLFVSSDSISELKENTSPSQTGIYPVQELYHAYSKASILQEERSSLKGWR